MPEHKGYQIPDEVWPDIVKSRLLDDLAADPKNKAAILAMTKAKYPNQPIPEHDIPQQVAAEYITPLKDDMKALREALEEEKGKRLAAEEQANLSKLVGEESVEEVRKVMTDKGISNPETAAEHLRMQRQTAPPRAMPPGLTFDMGEDFNEYMKDPRRTALKNAEKALNEIRSARR